MFDNKDNENGISRIKVGDFVLVVSIILATIANFTRFGISYKGVSQITAVTILIYIITMMTYNHCFNKGKIEGKQDKIYIDTEKEYNDEKDSVIKANLTGRLRDFTEYYIKNELVDYRKSLLLQYDIDYDTYSEKYLHMKSSDIMKEKQLDFRMKRAIIKCNKVKPISLSRYDIITDNEKKMNRSKPIGFSGNRMEKIDKVSQSIKRLLVSLFTGAIGVDIVLNFSWISVVTWAIRMLPILTALVTGQMNGFRNVTETEVSFKQKQIYMIRLFKDWCEKHKEDKPSN